MPLHAATPLLSPAIIITPYYAAAIITPLRHTFAMPARLRRAMPPKIPHYRHYAHFATIIVITIEDNARRDAPVYLLYATTA